jgi:hypothetical protein
VRVGVRVCGGRSEGEGAGACVAGGVREAREKRGRGGWPGRVCERAWHCPPTKRERTGARPRLRLHATRCVNQARSALSSDGVREPSQAASAR